MTHQKPDYGCARMVSAKRGTRAVVSARLTEREHEILRLVAAGLSNDEIAQDLVISPLTAKTHVSRILGKLRCRDRAQLVTLAYETGLVTPGTRSAIGTTQLRPLRG